MQTDLVYILRILRAGEYKSFTGNMSGMLIAEYLLSQRKENGTSS